MRTQRPQGWAVARLRLWLPPEGDRLGSPGGGLQARPSNFPSGTSGIALD